jgi:hypothetical protein
MSQVYPSDLFHAALSEAIQASGYSPTGLGQIWSAENDINPRTNEQRVRRLLEALPIQVVDLISLLDAIGYDVTIKKR